MNDPERESPGVIAPPPLIALGALALGLGLDWILPAYVLTILLTFYERLALGSFVAAAGLILAATGFMTFRAIGTNPEPWKPALHLATIGIYRYLRNPMYVGFALITAGIGIALASDWTLVLILPMMIVMHRGVVLREERYLEAKFGDDYRAYKLQVPRYGWPL